MKNKENNETAGLIGKETKTRAKSKWAKRITGGGLGRSFWANRSGLFSSRRPSAHWSGNLNLN